MRFRRAPLEASEHGWRCLRKPMNVFEHWFDIKRVVSILYWRVCYEVIETGFNFTSLLFAFAIHCASRVFRSHGPIERTAATAARATVSSRTAATRGADRLVPRRTGCADSRCFYLSNRDC